MFYHTLIAPDAPLLKDNNMFIYVLFIILPSLFNVPFYIPLSLYKPTNQSKSSSEFITVLIYIHIPSSQTLSYILCILNEQDSSLYILDQVSIFRVKWTLLWCKIHTNHFLASTNTPNYLILSFFHSNSSFSFFPSSFSSSSTSS